MKNIQASLTLIGLTLILASCTNNESNAFKITGEYIRIEPDTEGAYVPSGSDNPETDWSNASISVMYLTASRSGETKVVELAKGQFANDEITFEGYIGEPTEVEIFVQSGDEESLRTSAWLTPGGEEVSFALLDRQGAYPPDQLILVGISRYAGDPSRKFTIAGDLSAVEMTDLSMAIASVDATEHGDLGATERVHLGSVMLRDRSFVIEGEVKETTAITIRVDALIAWEYHSSTPAVIEPNSKIEVLSHAAPSTLMATSPSERHGKLIDSWQQSDEYQLLMQQYVTAWRKEQLPTQDDSNEDEPEGTIASNDTGLTGTAASDSSVESKETQGASTSDTKPADEDSKPASEVAASVSDSEPELVAEGCEHVQIVESEKDFRADLMALLSNYDYSESALLGQKLRRLQDDTLDQIAMNSEDPMDALLALELGAFTGLTREDQHLAIPIYDRIAPLLEEDLANRRVLRPRKALAQRLLVEANDEMLVPGQKAPEFNLPALDGTQFALHEILAEKQMAFVDFWASWCGPCIASFPELKELYATYQDRGFEVIAISIDDTLDKWEEASHEHDLPWLNIADIGGFGEETPIDYGVRSIPKGYLIDAKGCILQKNLTVEKLADELEARYDSAEI